jgi:hypothetical protein
VLSKRCVRDGIFDGSITSAVGFDDGRSDGFVAFRFDVGVCVG